MKFLGDPRACTVAPISIPTDCSVVHLCPNVVFVPSVFTRSQRCTLLRERERRRRRCRGRIIQHSVRSSRARTRRAFSSYKGTDRGFCSRSPRVPLSPRLCLSLCPTLSRVCAAVDQLPPPLPFHSFEPSRNLKKCSSRLPRSSLSRSPGPPSPTLRTMARPSATPTSSADRATNSRPTPPDKTFSTCLTLNRTAPTAAWPTVQSPSLSLALPFTVESDVSSLPVVDQATAWKEELVGVKDNRAHIRVSPDGSGSTRDSVRLVSKQRYSEGLYVWDVERMPRELLKNNNSRGAS